MGPFPAEWEGSVLPVYKHVDGPATYYSTKSGLSRFEFTPAQRKQLAPDVMAKMLALLPEDAREQEAKTVDDLSAMAAVTLFLGSRFQQTKEAREALAVELLREGEDPDAVKDAAGVSWAVLHRWCYGKTGSSRTAEALVPEDVLAYVSQKEADVAQERTAGGRAVLAREGAGDSSSREFRQLEERIRMAEDEYRQTAGEEPSPGASNELDELYALRDNWFV